MILDTITNRQFVFKNTDADNKKFTIPVDHENSPDEFFFVDIELIDGKNTETRQRTHTRPHDVELPLPMWAVPASKWY